MAVSLNIHSCFCIVIYLLSSRNNSLDFVNVSKEVGVLDLYQLPQLIDLLLVFPYLLPHLPIFERRPLLRNLRLLLIPHQTQYLKLLPIDYSRNLQHQRILVGEFKTRFLILLLNINY